MPGYDGLDRLTIFRRGTLHANNDKISTLTAYQTYTLDSTGNWTTFDDNGTSQARTHNAANEIGTISAWHNPAFDTAGNMTSGPKPGDGSSVDGAEQDYTYDAWNRLIRVRKRDYTASEAGEWVEVAYYRYDGLHRRIRKFAFTGTADTFDVHDYYYSRQWQVLEACTAEDVTWDPDADPVVEPSVATDVTEQNLWDVRYVDALAVRWYNLNPGTGEGKDSDFSDTNEELHATHDANFNITALVDTTGTVQERYEYDPYGKVRYMDSGFTGRGSSSFDNPYLYTGRRLDPDTGLYHYRTRPYHVQLGRFLGRDWKLYGGGDVNLYNYVSNGPLGAVDPFGESPWTRVARRKGSRAAWNELRSRLTAKFGAGMLRVHHIITRNIYDDPTLGKWLTDSLGVARDSKCNLIALPKDAAARKALFEAGQMKTKRSIHPGGHIDEYMEGVEKSVRDIYNRHQSGAISTQVAKNEVEKLRAGLRSGLRDGSIPLSRHDRNRLLKGAISVGGLVTLSLAAEDQALAAEALGELYMESVERKMNDPSVTKVGYFCAETYSGDEGAVGWIGWTIDLANPIADLLLVTDAAHILFYGVVYPDPEWIKWVEPADILERMEELRAKNGGD